MNFVPFNNRDLLLIDPRAGGRVEASLIALAAQLAADPRGQIILAGGVSGDDNEDDFWPDEEEDPWMARLRPYNVSNGTLSIPVQGVLLARFPYTFGGWATGYDYIERAFKRGVNDSAVQRIAFVIDSPGGMVSGCFDCVDAMADSNGKPVRSFAADSAYSAAYAIAAVGDKIMVTRTGGVGSIGVVTAHVDYSDAMKKEGIKVTFISSPKGGYKTEGNPYEPLSDEAEARIQARIDELYAVFVESVANNRNLDESAVRATQALCYGAADAIDVGLADSISRLDKGLAAFAAETNTGVISMAKTFTQEEHDAAITSVMESSVKAGAIEGAKTERARINAIMTCPAAEKRPTAARQLALASSMTTDEATAFLATIPEEKPGLRQLTEEEERAAAFTAAMGANNPGLHQQGSGDEKVSAADEIKRNYAAAGGKLKVVNK